MNYSAHGLIVTKRSLVTVWQTLRPLVRASWLPVQWWWVVWWYRVMGGTGTSWLLWHTVVHLRVMKKHGILMNFSEFHENRSILLNFSEFHEFLGKSIKHDDTRADTVTRGQTRWHTGRHGDTRADTVTHGQTHRLSDMQHRLSDMLHRLSGTKDLRITESDTKTSEMADSLTPNIRNVWQSDTKNVTVNTRSGHNPVSQECLDNVVFRCLSGVNVL